MYAEYCERQQQRNSVISSTNITAGVGASSATIAVLPKKPYRSVNTYLDRITIAGLHNYLYARGKYEKIAWNVTFLLAIAGTVCYLVPTVQRYLKSTIVLDIQHQTEPHLRLPNPWVCHSGVNVTYIREEAFEKVKPQLDADKRVQLLARRYNKAAWNRPTAATMDELINTALRLITIVPVWALEDWMDQFFQPSFAFEFISRAIQAAGSNWTGLTSYYEKGYLNCGSLVMNCALDGVEFDCCRRGQLGFCRTLDKCFVLDIRQEAIDMNLQQNVSKPIELQFETIIFDPSLEFYTTETGTWRTSVAFGNRADGLFDDSQQLQGGSTSVINVQGTKKTKLANCMDNYTYLPELHANSHPIIREYFEAMVDPDQYSVEACQMGKLFEVLFQKCGCVPYYDSMRPQDDNVICTPSHVHLCVYGAFQNVLPATDGTTGAPIEDDVKRDLFKITSKNSWRMSAYNCANLGSTIIQYFRRASKTWKEIRRRSIAPKSPSSSIPSIASRQKCTKWIRPHSSLPWAMHLD